jgi:hypothetical protein
MNDNQQLDNILNEALRAYRQTEPLDGLEDRVLQRLRMQPVDRRNTWWKWGTVAACAAMLAIAVWLGWRGHNAQAEATQLPVEVRNTLAPPETETKMAARPAATNSSETASHPSSTSQTKSSRETSRPLLATATRPAPAVTHDDPEREYVREPVLLTHEERQLITLAQTHPDALRAIAAEDQPISIAPLTIQPLLSEANHNGDN